jgi:hypothetical protein
MMSTTQIVILSLSPLYAVGGFIAAVIQCRRGMWHRKDSRGS